MVEKKLKIIQFFYCLRYFFVKIRKKMSYKPADSKKEEFRKYLEKAGVLDALTKTLVTLYEEPEKPNNALDFLRKNLCKKNFFFNLNQSKIYIKFEFSSRKSFWIMALLFCLFFDLNSAQRRWDYVIRYVF